VDLVLIPVGHRIKLYFYLIQLYLEQHIVLYIIVVFYIFLLIQFGIGLLLLTQFPDTMYLTNKMIDSIKNQ